jgi:hypothetical protein
VHGAPAVLMDFDLDPRRQLEARFAQCLAGIPDQATAKRRIPHRLGVNTPHPSERRSSHRSSTGEGGEAVISPGPVFSKLQQERHRVQGSFHPDPIGPAGCNGSPVQSPGCEAGPEVPKAGHDHPDHPESAAGTSEVSHENHKAASLEGPAAPRELRRCRAGKGTTRRDGSSRSRGRNQPGRKARSRQAPPPPLEGRGAFPAPPARRPRRQGLGHLEECVPDRAGSGQACPESEGQVPARPAVERQGGTDRDTKIAGQIEEPDFPFQASVPVEESSDHGVGRLGERGAPDPVVPPERDAIPLYQLEESPEGRVGSGPTRRETARIGGAVGPGFPPRILEVHHRGRNIDALPGSKPPHQRPRNGLVWRKRRRHPEHRRPRGNRPPPLPVAEQEHRVGMDGGRAQLPEARPAQRLIALENRGSALGDFCRRLASGLPQGESRPEPAPPPFQRNRASPGRGKREAHPGAGRRSRECKLADGPRCVPCTALSFPAHRTSRRNPALSLREANSGSIWRRFREIWEGCSIRGRRYATAVSTSPRSTAMVTIEVRG